LQLVATAIKLITHPIDNQLSPPAALTPLAMLGVSLFTLLHFPYLTQEKFSNYHCRNWYKIVARWNSWHNKVV